MISFRHVCVRQPRVQCLPLFADSLHELSDLARQLDEANQMGNARALWHRFLLNVVLVVAAVAARTVVTADIAVVVTAGLAVRALVATDIAVRAVVATDIAVRVHVAANFGVGAKTAVGRVADTARAAAPVVRDLIRGWS